MQLRDVVLITVGGFVGALGRHGVTLVLPETFPWGTLAVNIVGAFLLGFVAYSIETDDGPSETARLFVATGFISSFTTYSTFASETVALAAPLAAANVAANYALGFGAVLLAREVIRWRS
jgi:CrcB protein